MVGRGGGREASGAERKSKRNVMRKGRIKGGRNMKEQVHGGMTRGGGESRDGT